MEETQTMTNTTTEASTTKRKPGRPPKVKTEEPTEELMTHEQFSRAVAYADQIGDRFIEAPQNIFDFYARTSRDKLYFNYGPSGLFVCKRGKIDEVKEYLDRTSGEKANNNIKVLTAGA